MKAASEHIAGILEDCSDLGLEIGEDLFIGAEPPSPDNCVTVFDTPGREPMITLDGKKYYYPAIQVRVRNVDYRDAYSIAWDIYDKLNGSTYDVADDDVRYTLITGDADPAPLDRDENDRVRMIVNFETQRRGGVNYE